MDLRCNLQRASVRHNIGTSRPNARMLIRKMAVDVVTTIQIARPVSEVAAFAADPVNAPAWYVNITAVEWRSDPGVRAGARAAFVARFLGRQLAYTYEITAFEPDRRLVMRTAEGPFPMETTYEWTPSADGQTRMTLRNRGMPSGFFRLVAPALAAAMRRANNKDLAALKALLEGRATGIVGQ